MPTEPSQVAEWSANEASHPGLATCAVGDGDLFVEVVRPRDLVVLQTVWHGFDVRAAEDARPARLVAGADAILTVTLPFQHAQEYAAVLAGDSIAPKPEDPTRGAVVKAAAAAQQMPVAYRAARASRLVFDVPAGADVELSSAGILGLLPALAPRVHELATAGTAAAPYPDVPAAVAPPADGRWLIGDGLLLSIDRGRVRLAPATAAQRRALPDAEPAVLAQLELYLPRGSADISVKIPPERLPGLFRPGAEGGPTPARPADARGTYSHPPEPDRTAIEAPFRLVLSPDAGARWLHAALPQPASEDRRNVELWHTRLGRVGSSDGWGASDDPSGHDGRTVRAIWTRDRDRLGPAQWRSPDSDRYDEGDAGAGPLAPPHGADPHPFTSSLNRSDRHRLVRQSAETWIDAKGRPIPPVPIGAERLWLSALGATLDLHGSWNTLPYSQAQIPSILAWDHVAVFGRDQYVRVVYPGFLFPLGHRAVRVKITERRIRGTGRGGRPVAGLVQWNLIAVVQPDRRYTQRDLPFTDAHVSPATTPVIDDPGAGIGVNSWAGLGGGTYFWPAMQGRAYPFRVDAHDRAGDPFSFDAPLMWVAEDQHDGAAIWEAYHGSHPQGRVIDLGGARIALHHDDEATARLPVARMRLGGEAGVRGGRRVSPNGTSEPHLTTADVVVDAAERLAGTPELTIAYHPDAATGALGAGRVWAVVATQDQPAAGPAAAMRTAEDPVSDVLPGVRFGAAAAGTEPARSSENGGGFVAPSQVIAALSTRHGTVPDVDGGAAGEYAPDASAAAAALGSALPKLFGLVPLADLLGDDVAIPQMVTSMLGAVDQVRRALADADETVRAAARQAEQMVDAAVAAAQQTLQDAQDLVTAAEAVVTGVEDVLDALAGLAVPPQESEVDQVKDAFRTEQDRLRILATRMRELGEGVLAPFVRGRLTDAAAGIDAIAGAADIVDDLLQATVLAAQLAAGAKQLDLRFDWSPPLKDWPATGDPVLEFLPERAPGEAVKVREPLSIRVSGRAGAAVAPALDVRAELRGIRLNLLPVEPLVRIDVEHLAFHAGTSGKAEVDVVMGGIEFVGLLSFIQTIKDLIPFDGFSDPPNVTVDASGLTAGFTLALPNLAVGVFSLSNMSLSADVRVPFLGDGLSVGFGFCSRERPFALSVCFLGGGGWVGLRLSPTGLEVLEVGFEAGAYLSVDFGVASGSVSAAIGVYLRLEGAKGSLTGYFRIRGHVDVLGLISASIELAMSLEYVFDEQKLIGRASITVEVEVLCFSQSVSISAERKFAGANGDPTIAELLEGTGAWDEYLDAFAQEDA